MGASFQQLSFSRSHSHFPNRIKCKLLESYNNNRFPHKGWSWKQISTAAAATLGLAPLVSFHSEPIEGTLLGFFPAAKRRNIRKHRIPQWRCCDPDGTAETSAPVEGNAEMGNPNSSPKFNLTLTPDSTPTGESKGYADSSTHKVLKWPEQDDAASANHETMVYQTEQSDDAIAHDSVEVQVPLPNNVNNEANSQLFDQEEQVKNKGLLQQMRDIVLFAGPVLGIWFSGPFMSLIDTAVVGNSSLLELAALGPGTVFCDQVGYVFMFLSVATSNLIATSLAKQDKNEAAHHLSRLLFVALACGICMLILTGTFSPTLLKAFVGPQNASLVPASCSYVQIRGLAWPAVLVGLVAQSASLGMQDSWGPLKVLAVASFVNALGDILFCTCLNYGIAGAAWATMLSQYVGGYLMLRSLSMKGYNALSLCVPSFKELLYMLKLFGPVLLTMFSKMSFYVLVTYLSTSLGAVTLAAHQVMIGLLTTCTVPGEPLAQTAQSFMPGLIQGSNQNLKKARMLLRSLLVIGAFFGVSFGILGICFPCFFPQVFTHDTAVISQMRAVTLPFFWVIFITPPLLSLEGTLLAGGDLKFLSLSMIACLVTGSSLLTVSKRLGFGLQGFWWTMGCFQSIRFLMALARLTSRKSILRDSQTAEYITSRLKSS